MNDWKHADGTRNGAQVLRRSTVQSLVFENQIADDAILKISKLIGCDHYEADMYRRAFAKKNEEKVFEFMQKMGDQEDKADIHRELMQLGNFGLCRAHAVNLGRLIWALAYQKAHNPQAFWGACLKHCQGSYRSWVYKREALLSGWEIDQMGYKVSGESDPWRQFRKSGWWTTSEFLPGMNVMNTWLDRWEFTGLIANGRVFKGDSGKYVTFLTLGVGNGRYIDVTVKRPLAYSDSVMVSGTGRLRHSNGSDYLECVEAEAA